MFEGYNQECETEAPEGLSVLREVITAHILVRDKHKCQSLSLSH